MNMRFLRKPYFRKTADYIYSSQLTPSGLYDFAFRFINGYTVFAGRFYLAENAMTSHIAEAEAVAEAQNVTSRTPDVGAQMTALISLPSLVMDSMNEFITDIIIFRDPVANYNDLQEIAPFSFSGVDPRAAAHLRGLGYWEHSWRHIDTTFLDGFQVRRYSEEVFTRVANWNFPRLFASFAAGASAALVSAILGVPTSAVVGITRFVVGSGGYWVLSRNADIFYQEVFVVTERVSHIHGNPRFLQSRIMHYRILFGDYGTLHNSFGVRRIDPSFNNPSAMAREAIRRYRKNIWQIW